ncbi:hypothetical protein JOF28_001073 [Leucobacter exalbidus]|uniref:DUF262 domain-containing protein n=1 Tax=Leucobacter exalbidus TaxID=662960 RepID=A0A940PX79_9MICO|nr:DUF262 domain-containing protein [Leucobacter exalbidus]MBP1325841.1 hypothetical protein [Leucobacter exalbidus]
MTLTTDLRSEALSVAGVFSPDSRYSVPAYQRNYAWETPQIEQLILDIKAAMHEQTGDQAPKSYFLGNLVVQARPLSPGSKITEYSVIDGQQRLTTLTLLLSYLSRARKNSLQLPSNPIENLTYDSRPRSAETLRLISHVTSAGELPEEDRLDAGIVNAFGIISQTLKQLDKDLNLDAFTRFVLDQVTVVRVELPFGTDLNRYFEIMNTRGQQLQQVDIVKARLMSVLHNGNHDPAASAVEVAAFAWIWDACAEMHSYVQQSLTMGNTSLRSKMFTAGTWAWLKPQSFAELVESWTAAPPSSADPCDSSSSQSGFPRATTMSLDEAIKYYEAVPADIAEEESDAEQFRSTIEYPSFLMHVLKVFKGHAAEADGGLDDSHLIRSFDEEFSKHDAEHVREFIFLLLRARNLFDAFILKREYLARSSDEGMWSLRRVVKRSSRESRRGLERQSIGYVGTFAPGEHPEDSDSDVEYTASEIQTHVVRPGQFVPGGLLQLQSMLRVTYTSPRTMHWITLVLDFVLQQPDPTNVAERDLLEILLTHTRSRVHDAYFADVPPVGFSIPRIVFTYLDFLLLRGNHVPGFSSSFTFGFRTSIEHFFPQHPSEQPGEGEAVSNELLHSLGNLALVSVSNNSRFSNLLPGAKAEGFKTTIETQSPKLALMASMTRAAGAWNDALVKQHHEDMERVLREDLSNWS